MVLVTSLLPSVSSSFPKLAHRPKHPANPHFHINLRSRPRVLQLLLCKRDFPGYRILHLQSVSVLMLGQNKLRLHPGARNNILAHSEGWELNPPRTAGEHQGEHRDHAFRKEKPRPLCSEERQEQSWLTGASVWSDAHHSGAGRTWRQYMKLRVLEAAGQGSCQTDAK